LSPCIRRRKEKRVNFESGAKRKEALLYHSLLDTLTDNLQVTPSHIFFSLGSRKKKNQEENKEKRENKKKTG
jgi:hypothetical protein